MKKMLSLVVILALLLTFAAGCASSSTATSANGTTSSTTASSKPTSTEPAVSDELYIGVYCLGNLEYFYDHKIGLEEAGKLMGVKTKYVGPPDYDINAMIAAFEQAIAEKPAGIITFGAEDSLMPVINKAVDSGIPVVTVDGDVKKSKRVAFVGTGNYSAGVLGGTKLAEALGGKGKVAILTEPGVDLHRDRAQGYKDALAKFPEIEIVQEADTKADPVNTVQVMAAILQKYPDLAGVGCTDAVGGAASATAIEEAGLAGKIKIVSMDRDRQVLEKITKGIVTGTIVQKSALMPFYALQILYNMKHSQIQISTDNAKANVTYAPNNIDTGVIYVDETNAQYFIRDIK